MRITLYGLAGTGTSSVGKLLAERLGYKFVSGGSLMRGLAKENGLPLSEFLKLAESDERYDRLVDGKLKELANDDNIVVESRLAWYFIPDSCKIKLECDFDTRVRRVADRDGLSFEEAKNAIIIRERNDHERYEKLYGITSISDFDFDIIVDTSVLSVEDIVKMLISRLIYTL